MSRRRYLSTKISQDAKINRLATQHGDFAALLYTWMIPHAEDDGTLSGDPEEVLMTVVPGRRDKSVEDITAALIAMHELGLIIWNRDDAAHPLVMFPASFHTYQSYITKERRKGAQPDNSSDDAPQISAQDSKSAQNAANQRKTPQNAASFSSSFSVSLSPPTEGAASDTPTEADATEPPQDVSAPVARSTKPTPSLVALPERRASDTTDRVYWTRIVKEATNAQRLPLLVLLAHEKIGVDDTPGGDGYKRLGKLAKEHGAGLVAGWILQAAGQHIDGHPLDYLTKLASGQIARASPKQAVGAPIVRREPPAFHTADQSPPANWR